MKCFLKVFFAILFIFLNVGKSYSEDKIAYINLETVLQDSTYGKKIIEELNKVNSININSLKKLEDELKLQENKLKKDQLDIFFNKINPYVQKYMDNNSISILLDSKKIYIGKSENDLTKDIINLINQELN